MFSCRFPWRQLLFSGFATLFFVARGSAAPPTDPGFPKADPAHAFSAIKVYDASGSPLRLPVEDWDGARKRVATDPEWATWIAGQRSEMDDWMAKRKDHIEWICGWYHDFFSPKDGSHLIWTPDEPGKFTLHSVSDPHVELTPKLRAAWVYEFRASFSEHIQKAAQLYRITGDARYGAWAAAQLDFYADNYAAWPRQSKNPGTHFMWQSLDEATDLVHYAEATRILGSYVTPERKQRWFTSLFQPECHELSTTFQAVHNIACWHRSAVGCVALLYNDPTLWASAVDSKFGVRNQVSHGVTSDYLWREQSMGYNAYVASALLPFFEGAAVQGKTESLRVEMESIENLLLAPIYMRFPTGQLPNPADAGAPGKAPNEASLADSARIFPTTLGIAAAAKRKDWDSLIDPLPAPARPVALPAVTSLNMESTRMAIIKSGDWQVYLHYGQLTAAHSQAEALNFEAFAGSTDVSHDPGTVGYGSPLYKGFYATGVAHNVPLVDGLGQNGISPGKLISFDASVPSVSAAQPKYRANASVQRDMSIAGAQLMDTVTVNTTDGLPHDIGLLMQLQGKATLPDSFKADDSFGKGTARPVGFSFWTDSKSASFTDSAEFPITFKDHTVIKVKISLPGPFTVTHASTPDYPPYRRDVFFVQAKGTTAVFKTEYDVVSRGTN